MRLQGRPGHCAKCRFQAPGISSLDLILEERSVFCREIQGKFYTPLAYYLSKVLVDGLMLR